jgi:hypothetical protein
MLNKQLILFILVDLRVKEKEMRVGPKKSVPTGTWCVTTFDLFLHLHLYIIIHLCPDVFFFNYMINHSVFTSYCFLRQYVGSVYNWLLKKGCYDNLFLGSYFIPFIE